MDPPAFFAASRLLIVAGKGGVGKTTVSAVLARAAALCGLSVLVLAVDGGTNLGALLGAEAPLDDAEVTLATGLGAGGTGTGSIRARAVTASAALAEYLDQHGLKRLLGRIVRTGVLDVVSTAAPGIEDLLVLGKVKGLERGGTADLIIVDGPAAGHALAFLRSPRGLADIVTGGPIATQAAEVLAMLADEARCRLLLVTLAEETPVNELIEAAYRLEDEVGVALAPIIVNAVYPDIAGLGAALPSAADALRAAERDALAAAAAFRCERASIQREQRERLAASLPLAQLELPFRFTAGVTVDDVDALAADLVDAIGRLP